MARKKYEQLESDLEQHRVVIKDQQRIIKVLQLRLAIANAEIDILLLGENLNRKFITEG